MPKLILIEQLTCIGTAADAPLDASGGGQIGGCHHRRSTGYNGAVVGRIGPAAGYVLQLELQGVN